MAKAKSTQVATTSEAKAPEAVMSFEDFLKKNPKHPGLIASFKYEALVKGDSLGDRTEKEWVIGFEEQSNKTY